MSDDGLVVPDYEPSAAPPPMPDAPNGDVGVKPVVRVGGMAPRAAMGVTVGGVLVVFVLIAALGGGGGSDDPEPESPSGPAVATNWASSTGTGSAPSPPSRGSTTSCAAINPCDSNPCVHGTCSADDILSVDDLANPPVCTCEVGWGGSRCDQARTYAILQSSFVVAVLLSAFDKLRCDQSLATLESAAVGGGWFLVRRAVGTWQ